MLKLLRGAVTAAAFATGLSAMLAIAVSTGSSAAASDQEIAQALRAGGLVIVLRHGATFPDKADTDPLNFDNIAAQRNLNDKGNIEKTEDLTEGGLVVSPNENNRRAEALRALLATPPQAGTDTILVTHYPNIIAALGKDWFDVKEGEASIFRPDNGSYKLLARIQMDEWPRIAAAAKPSAQR